MKGHTIFLWIKRLTIIEISIILNSKYRCNVIPIKIPVDQLEEIGKMILKLVKKCKNLREARTSLKKENKVIGLSLLDFKIYWDATVIKTIWYWCKDGQIGEWNRIESPSYRQLVDFDKGVKLVHWGKGSLFNKSPQIN